MSSIRWYLTVATLGISLASSSCGHPGAWSSDEKQNFAHYIKSAEADIAAADLSNQGQPFATRSADVVAEMLRLQKQALAEAKLVNDQVLEKAFAGMSVQYRNLYQRSLELRIKNLEVGDLPAEVEGSHLHDQWVDWIEPRQARIRVPE